MRYTYSLRAACTVVILSLCAACSVHSGPTHTQTAALKDAAPLDPGAAVYVMMPQDFSAAGSTETGSGGKAQAAVMKVLAPLGGKKLPIPVPQTLEAAMQRAADSGCDYVLDIRISVWQDPPASFQLSPDRGALLLNLYAVPETILVRTDSVECSGWATTVNLIGAYGPQDCLVKALEDWRVKAFGR